MSDQQATPGHDLIPFMVVFEDHERAPKLVVGRGRALDYYRKISYSWNAHLFVKVDSNHPDCKYPSATLADTTLLTPDKNVDCPDCDGDGRATRHYVLGNAIIKEKQDGTCETCDARGFVPEQVAREFCQRHGFVFKHNSEHASTLSQVSDADAFDTWMHERLFANPPQPVSAFDAFQAGRLQGQLDMKK